MRVPGPVRSVTWSRRSAADVGTGGSYLFHAAKPLRAGLYVSKWLPEMATCLAVQILGTEDSALITLRATRLAAPAALLALALALPIALTAPSASALAQAGPGSADVPQGLQTNAAYAASFAASGVMNVDATSGSSAVPRPGATRRSTPPGRPRPLTPADQTANFTPVSCSDTVQRQVDRRVLGAQLSGGGSALALAVQGHMYGDLLTASSSRADRYVRSFRDRRVIPTRQPSFSNGKLYVIV